MVTPKYQHKYTYPCTFLGTVQLGPDVRDLYHTVTFEGPILLIRHGDEHLSFIGENAETARRDKDDSESFSGEAYRLAEKMNLQLEKNDN